MASVTEGNIEIAPTNAYVFTNASNYDMILYTTASNQRILMGTQCNNIGTVIVDSNVSVITSLAVGKSNPTTTLDVNGTVRFVGGAMAVSNNMTAYGTVTFSNSVVLASNLVAMAQVTYSNVLTTTSNVVMLGPSTLVSSNLYVMGYVGIGTSNPSDPVTIVASNIALSNYGKTMIYSSNNNLGLGTQNPLTLFHVKGDTTLEGNLVMSTSFRAKGIQISKNTTGVPPNFNIYNAPGVSYNTGSLYVSTAASNSSEFIAFITGSNPNTEKMRITGVTGSVGIGTQAPEQKLDVIGTIKASPSANCNALMAINSNLTNTQAIQIILGHSSSASNAGYIRYVHYGSNSSNLMIIGMLGGPSNMMFTSSGNVGIGNSAPGVALDVTGQIRSSNANNGQIVMNPGSTGNNCGYMAFHIASGTRVAYIGWLAATANYLAMTIENGFSGFQMNSNLIVDGNIGVGTTAMSYRMDVRGTVAASNYVMNNNGLAAPATGTNGGTGDRIILWPGGTGAYPYSIGMNGGTMWFSVPGSMQFNWYSGGTAGMVLKNNQLGIGNTSPSYELDVTGVASVTSNILLPGGGYATHFFTSTATWINLPTTGPSGIGTGGPGVNPFIAYVSAIGNWFNNNTVIGDVAYRNLNGRILMGTNANHPNFIIGTNYVYSSNNFCVGTLTSTNTLTVAGGTSIGAGLVSTTAPANGLIVQGYVGISNSAPAHMLHMTGNNSNRVMFTNGSNATGFYVGIEDVGDANGGFNGQVWNASNAAVRIGTSNVERMRITSNGLVGVGISNPSVALDVIGAIKTSTIFTTGTSDSSNAPGYAWSNDLTTGMYRLSAAQIGFTVGGSNVMTLSNGLSTILSSNMIVSGTTTFSNTVNMLSNVNILGQLTVSNVSYITSNITIYASEIVQSNLTVYNAVTLCNDLFVNSNTTVGRNLAVVGISTFSNTLTVTPNTNNRIRFTNTSNASGFYVGIEDSSTTGNGHNGRVWNASNSALCLGTSNVERMRITSNGLVGILTSNPQYTLDIAGSVYALGYCNLIIDSVSSGSTSNAASANALSNAYSITVATSNAAFPTSNIAYPASNVTYTNSNVLYPTSNAAYTASNRTFNSLSNNASTLFVTGSNIAIGTNTSTSLLQLNSNSQSYMKCTNTSNGTGVYVGIEDAADVRGGFNGVFWNASNAGLRFGTNNSERMRVTSAGLLGINTTSPSNTLTVSGAFSVGSTFATASAPVNGAIIQGNVGISKSNPAYTLDVTGDINFTGSLYQGGVAFTSGGGGGGGGGWSNTSTNIFVIGSNVGIGTQSPSEALQVSGGKIFSDTQVLGTSNDTSNVPSFSFKQDSNTGIFHPTTGQVGITAAGSNVFTASPSNILLNTSVQMPSTVTFAGFSITQRTDATTLMTVPQTWTNSACNVYITGSNVGIGKTNPAFPLDVNGIINATNLYVAGAPYIGSQWANSNNIVYLLNSNVGIGTSNPTSTLTVNGTLEAASNPYCFLSGNGGNTLISANNKVSFNVVVTDNTSSWSTTNHNYTAPKTGKYQITFNIYVGSGAPRFLLYKNGSVFSFVTSIWGVGQHSTSATLFLNANDVIDIRPNGDITLFYNLPSQSYHHTVLYITFIP